MKARNTKKNPPRKLGGSKTRQVFKTEAAPSNHHRSQKQQLATSPKPLVTPPREYGNVTT